jgi:hypothetical protein
LDFAEFHALVGSLGAISPLLVRRLFQIYVRIACVQSLHNHGRPNFEGGYLPISINGDC